LSLQRAVFVSLVRFCCGEQVMLAQLEAVCHT